MLFNSISFAIFLPVVFVLYWFVFNNNLKWQNLFLLSASYFFYSCWDWRFLFLLAFSTFLDYFTGLQMFSAKTQATKKFWFWLSVIVNVSFLGVFKYYNFFSQSFADAVSHVGFYISPWTIKVILPVGISFYTFHGLSYVIDIYNNKIKPEKNFVEYALFVSFFPLLVAGPIERATHLLPQVKQPRHFDYTRAADGLRQILWGLFKKIAIADNCAQYANIIFNHSSHYSGATLLMGALFFTFQIYCDFSGYSDIALGTARLFGFELLRNFAFPYFSRDIAEFWRRWHISLSTWFRDYLYIPLGGSKGGTWMRIRNTFIIFIVSGFWHGANWTFIVWGALNAVYFLPLLLTNNNRNNLDTIAQGKLFPSLKETVSMFVTFGLTVIAWVFFRSRSISQATSFVYNMIKGLFHASTYKEAGSFISGNIKPLLFILIGIFILVEWLGREQQYALANLGVKWKRPFRYAMYYALIVAIFWFDNKEQFIYFQF